MDKYKLKTNWFLENTKDMTMSFKPVTGQQILAPRTNVWSVQMLQSHVLWNILRFSVVETHVDADTFVLLFRQHLYCSQQNTTHCVVITFSTFLLFFLWADGDTAAGGKHCIFMALPLDVATDLLIFYKQTSKQNKCIFHLNKEAYILFSLV